MLNEEDLYETEILRLLGLVLLWGCETMSSGVPLENAAVSRRFVSFRQVYTGMTRQEVEGVLGTEVIIGYESREADPSRYYPITMKNPTRQAEVVKDGRTYQVDYYFAGIEKADGQITDDELVPLVFYKDRLVGSGWTYLNTEIQSP